MKQVSPTDFKRLEQKINLLNDKLDRIMEAQGITLVKGKHLIQKEEEKKRRTRERQQQKLLEQEHLKNRIERTVDNRRLWTIHGRTLQLQYNLAQPPNGERIRRYLQAKDPRAFDGLKRAGQGKKK